MGEAISKVNMIAMMKEMSWLNVKWSLLAAMTPLYTGCWFNAAAAKAAVMDVCRLGDHVQELDPR